MRLPNLLAALFVMVILLGLHLVALSHFYYWRYEWFDIPMHMLGGVAIAFFLLGIFGRVRLPKFLLLVGVIVVGWEVLEYVTGLSLGQPNYVFDTLHDIFNGYVGALVAYVSCRFAPCRCK